MTPRLILELPCLHTDCIYLPIFAFMAFGRDALYFHDATPLSRKQLSDGKLVQTVQVVKMCSLCTWGLWKMYSDQVLQLSLQRTANLTAMLLLCQPIIACRGGCHFTECCHGDWFVSNHLWADFKWENSATIISAWLCLWSLHLCDWDNKDW